MVLRASDGNASRNSKEELLAFYLSSYPVADVLRARTGGDVVVEDSVDTEADCESKL